MKRRRLPRVEEVNNHDRWLVSYADFITLLFAFFVVMYSISSVNEGTGINTLSDFTAGLRPKSLFFIALSIGSIIVFSHG